ncbi:MAG: hypothetical protein KOO63_08355 [Bacteroidales bacterium]|nr:hypothetical protein [Candidatus Latescibacterota bacterium]
MTKYKQLASANTAQLPRSYEEMTTAIALCESVDECKDWADKAAALASYHRQSKDTVLMNRFMRIQARAIRRAGEVLETIEPQSGGDRKSNGGQPPLDNTRTAAAREAGMSPHQQKTAMKIARIPKEEFEELVESYEPPTITRLAVREAEKREQPAPVKRELPAEEYNLIYADPPWRYEHSKTDNRKIENHYPTMDLLEICNLPIGALAHEDCVLFMWTTSPKLFESMAVIEAWGFSYRTCAVWDKEIIGMGYYFRQQHEILLIATKGSPGTPDPSMRVSSIIKSRREKHSKKPDLFYGLIESMYPNAKKLELFARKTQPGWSAWGNDAQL